MEISTFLIDFMATKSVFYSYKVILTLSPVLPIKKVKIPIKHF